ncbi:putative protein kinase activity [Lyophyllum shimeji]|uniref:Protein kinase domain-containing protein n=1 Tax=Lyophyllum shimeji TaxID=47721 RepID=A0A9P3PIZ9_LYOSH|nr:putative protein kinase activity [Lyophyllum shimeji]
MPTRTSSTDRYTACWSTHALPKNIPCPVINPHSLHGDAYTSTHYGSLGNMQVEVKVWRGCTRDRRTRDRFITHLAKELDDWKRASGHRNVSPFLGLVDGFSWDGLPSLVTPRYLNGNINQYLRANPRANLLSLLNKVGDALTYMHSLSPPVAHGGIRGANILIADDGEPRLSDLCINFLPHAPDFTVAGDELDAERWMAPEILDPAPELQGYYNVTTPESDVYSFGMTMLELFSGSHPARTLSH